MIPPPKKVAPATQEATTLPPRSEHESELDIQTGVPVQDRQEGSSSSQERAVPWDFLSPPQEPGELGRLGPYRIVKVLGIGGMGVVFHAQDSDLQRAVAVKAMLPQQSASPAARKRFLREARAAAALKHDHIVTIYHVGEDRSTPFLAMEFLEGESLDHRLHREPCLPLDQVLHIGAQIARALDAAHARQLIHRDIKPGNVFLESVVGGAAPGAKDLPATDHGPRTRDFRVKILDFGLARTGGDPVLLTQEGAIVGTPAYMAPEQASGQPVDHRCDLFSLGCVLYRMCTGVLPFKRPDTVSTLVAIATEQPSSPREHNPAVPAALADLIMHLLAKKPEQRPPSAGAVAEALEAIARNEPPTLTWAPERRGPKVRLPWRLRWIHGLAAAAVLGAILIYLAVFHHSPPETGKDTDVDPGTKHSLLEWEADPHYVHAIAVLPDGRHAVAAGGSGEIRLWDLEKGAAIGSFQGHESWVSSLALSPDGRYLLSGSNDRTVRLWDVASRKQIRRFLGHTDTVWSVAFAPNGRRVVSGGADRTARVWDSWTGVELLRFTKHASNVWCVGVAPDGKRVLSSSGGSFNAVEGGWIKGDDNIICLWELDTGRELHRLTGHTNWVIHAAFSPDGDQVLSASGDRSVRLWDARDGRELGRLEGHTDGVHHVAFSTDGRRALSTSHDRSVRVWDVSSRRELRRLDGHSKVVYTASFVADGRRALSGGLDKRLRFSAPSHM
jgi:WD40 repeat protein